jgi:heterodisulfide reductase subunit C
VEESIYIDIDEADPEFAEEVAREPGGEGILDCYACGTCTAGCPVRSVSEKYNPRRIIRMVLLGLRDEVLKSEFIWLCSTCYTCQERCPQNVRITDIMTALRNIAARSGILPDAYVQQRELILNMGRLYEIDDFDNKKRAKAGLPAIEMKADEIRRLYESVRGGPESVVEESSGEESETSVDREKEEETP